MDVERVLDAFRKLGVRFPEYCPMCRTALSDTKVTAKDGGVLVACDHCGYAIPFDAKVMSATLKGMETEEKMQTAPRQERRAHERAKEKEAHRNS